MATHLPSAVCRVGRPNNQYPTRRDDGTLGAHYHPQKVATQSAWQTLGGLAVISVVRVQLADVLYERRTCLIGVTASQWGCEACRAGIVGDRVDQES